MLAKQMRMPDRLPESLPAALDPARLNIVLIEPIGASLPNSRFLLSNDIYKVRFVIDTRELSLLSAAESFALALISDTLGGVELDHAARSIRKQWPTARIVILGRAAELLEDYLYDNALTHSFGQEDLCDTLTRMSTQHTHGRPFQHRLKQVSKEQ